MSQFWNATDCGAETTIEWMEPPTQSGGRTTSDGPYLQEDDGEFWSYAKYEYEAYVTSLDQGYAQSWQIIELYRKRADCENVFDELKNQWGFNGFAADIERSPKMPLVYCCLLIILGIASFVFWNRTDMSKQKDMEDAGSFLSQRVWSNLSASELGKWPFLDTGGQTLCKDIKGFSHGSI